MGSGLAYRLGLDLGTSSIGWCMVRLDDQRKPNAIIRMGVRIFPDGRNPKDGSSLAVTRRMARQMRRRRDRLLKRKAKLQEALVSLNFWPKEPLARHALVSLDPYLLRKEGLTRRLTPEEFGRAVFHLNQRRGFQSNRKTDRKDREDGLLKSAVKQLRQRLIEEGARTVGEWLAWRHERRETVRARLRGRSAKDRAYDLYIDRAMIADEFDRLWMAQAAFDSERYTDARRDQLRDILFHQQPLKPVKPGRCTLIPEEERAPIALPSVQRFRIYQEANNLRVIGPGLEERPLTLAERNTVVELLECGDATFTKIRKRLNLPGSTRFNIEDVKRDRLKGNATSAALGRHDRFGERWSSIAQEQQDLIVQQLLNEASESALVSWLVANTEVDEGRAEAIAAAGLPEGYGNLSAAAVTRILPALRAEIITYADAVRKGGFASHSELSRAEQDGEILAALPYYGEALQRHVGFGTGDPADPPEKRFGKIANPTVHIGLNELRKVINALIDRYGHPAEIVVEIARELKQGKARRDEIRKEQADKQRQNESYLEEACNVLGLSPRNLDGAKRRDLSQRMQLWVELNRADATNRRCPYTGEQIGISRLLSEEVEIDHILPFSATLDDSLNNKTVAMRRANREKGNRSPFEAFGHSPADYDYAGILERAALMPREKAKRFAEDGYQRWLREDKDFLARALNDTAYLSRIAREYLCLVCPPNRVRVIPGRLTAMLRGKFGLNQLLSGAAEKNRNDHRHHAIDAAVVAVTDQSLLKRFADASADAREKRLSKLVESMPLPWLTYREHVARAVRNVIVSFKPDHGFEGGMHNDTAYGIRPDGFVVHRVMLDDFKSAAEIERYDFLDKELQKRLLDWTAGLSGKAFLEKVDAFKQANRVRRTRIREKLKVIPMRSDKAPDRHGRDETGESRAYKGYKGDSNYCIEIWKDERGRWKGDVVSTFEAYRIARSPDIDRLRRPKVAQNGKELIARLVVGDTVRMAIDGHDAVYRVYVIKSSSVILLAEHFEANVDSRNRESDGAFKYLSKRPGSLMTSRARKVTVSVLGDLRDYGFSG